MNYLVIIEEVTNMLLIMMNNITMLIEVSQHLEEFRNLLSRKSPGIFEISQQKNTSIKSPAEGTCRRNLLSIPENELFARF